MHRIPSTFLTSRAACILVCVFTFMATIVLNCRQNTVAMMLVLCVDGMAALLWIGSAIALGIVLLGRFRTNALLTVATGGGLGLGIYSLVGLGLGLAGWLNRPVALAIPAISIALWLFTMGRKPGGIRQYNSLAPLRIWVSGPAGFAWVWIIPVAALAMACVAASVLPGVLWKPLDPHPYDVTSYHLQVVREWFEAGRIVPLRHNMFSYFPLNVEIQFLLLMHLMGGPWTAMYACQFISVGYTVLMVLAVAGASRERSSAVGAAIVATVPWVLMLAGVAYVESGLMLYTALAIAWVIHAGFSSNPRDGSFIKPMLLAGVMAGFACGVKFTAVPMLLLAAPMATLISLLIRRPVHLPLRRLLLGCAGFVLAGSIVVSPWLIRNFFWTANPVWPLAMTTLGKGRFSDAQVTRFIKAHSPTAAEQSLSSRVEILWHDVIDHWQFGYIILPAGLLAIAWQWRDRQMWLLLLTALIILVVWIGFTHLLARFLVMLIPLAGVAIARVPWGKAWPIGVMVLMIATCLGWGEFIPQLQQQSAVPVTKALFGITDLSTFPPQAITDQMHNASVQVGLVGDAQAFFYQIPMARLHYRSVFDVPADATDPIDAWASPKAKGDPNYLLMINTSEIARLNHTYYRIPALPPQWLGRFPDTFVLRGDQLPDSFQHSPH